VNASAKLQQERCLNNVYVQRTVHENFLPL
jgi:hypothetical protein